MNKEKQYAHTLIKINDIEYTIIKKKKVSPPTNFTRNHCINMQQVPADL